MRPKFPSSHAWYILRPYYLHLVHWSPLITGSPNTYAAPYIKSAALGAVRLSYSRILTRSSQGHIPRVSALRLHATTWAMGCSWRGTASSTIVTPAYTYSYESTYLELASVCSGKPAHIISVISDTLLRWLFTGHHAHCIRAILRFHAIPKPYVLDQLPTGRIYTWCIIHTRPGRCRQPISGGGLNLDHPSDLSNCADFQGFSKCDSAQALPSSATNLP